jgi:hypothetical protein
VLQTLLDLYTPLKLIFVKNYDNDQVFKANTTDMIIYIIKEIFDSTTNLLLLYVGYRLTITQQQNMRKILRKERNIKGSSDYSDESHARLTDDIGEVPRISQLGKTVVI